jgi:hypothetical protein
MHLVGPYLTTTGKKKGKAKFRNADAANKARKNAEAWQELLNKWDIKVETKTTKVRTATGFNPVVRNAPVVDPRRLTNHIPSLDTGEGIAVKKDVQQYTGTAMVGIGQLHKSNAIPVFSKEDAIDISKMRRG